MLYLFLSILFNAGIYITFKLFERFKVNVFEAIVINYITALSFGLLVVPELKTTLNQALTWPLWSVSGIGMGLFFISIFYLTALTAQKIGVSVSTIASKMSLALAVILFAIVDPNEPLTLLKSTAIVFALSGVILVSISSDIQSFSIKNLTLPLLVLIGSTLVDFSIAQFSKFPENDSQMALFSCLPFFTSGTIGLTVLIYKKIRGKSILSIKDVIAGIVLGCINYGSIYFLVKVYDSGIWPRSILLPINNLSVVLLTALLALLFFKEKLNRINLIGIVLSIAALLLLMSY